jgi:PmbA/TldA metallopeptidase C-terminal domain
MSPAGRTAGLRFTKEGSCFATVSDGRRGAKKMPTCRCPVVFDPRVARSFISHLLGAISGPAIARGTSFLKDRLGERIFPEAITILDDPHRPRTPDFTRFADRRIGVVKSISGQCHSGNRKMLAGSSQKSRSRRRRRVIAIT